MIKVQPDKRQALGVKTQRTFSGFLSSINAFSTQYGCNRALADVKSETRLVFVNGRLPGIMAYFT